MAESVKELVSRVLTDESSVVMSVMVDLENSMTSVMVDLENSVTSVMVDLENVLSFFVCSLCLSCMMVDCMSALLSLNS